MVVAGCQPLIAILGIVVAFSLARPAPAQLPDSVEFVAGAVNSLRIRDSTVIYGDPAPAARPAKQVLFTHGRRDVAWAGVSLVRNGAEAIVPAAERDWFESPSSFWNEFEKARFHDYAQRTTKVPREALPIARAVRGGDVLDLDGVRIEVIETPGYSPGAVSYLIHVDGRRIVCTGVSVMVSEHPLKQSHQVVSTSGVTTAVQ